MAEPSDPDRDLDLLLRRAFRASSTSPASGSRSPASSSSACVDAETLATWGDGLLRADEVVALESHVADCPRCRAMLAAFVRADAPVSTPSSVATREPLWRRWRLQFLVPVAATATALAVFIAAPEPPDPTASSARDAVHEERRVTTPESPQAAPADGFAPVPGTRTAQVALEPQGRGALARDQPPAAREQVDEAAGGEAGVERQRRARELGRAPELDQAARLDQSAREEVNLPSRKEQASNREGRPTGVDALAKATPAGSPSQAAAGAALAEAQGGARQERAAPQTAQADRNTAAAAPPRETVGALRTHEAADVRPLPMAAANAGAQWRVNGLRVERLGVSGGWTAVALPPNARADVITAGAMAGPVVWLVGRGGLVLVSTDGVRFSARASVPGMVDLVGVEARDARSATVTTVDDRRLATVDGGATWSGR